MSHAKVELSALTTEAENRFVISSTVGRFFATTDGSQFDDRIIRVNLPVINFVQWYEDEMNKDSKSEKSSS